MMQDHNEVIRTMAELFPRAFFVDGRLRQPLKKNITAEIEAQHLPQFEGVSVGGALDWYTGHYGYLKSLAVAGSRRLDLDGNPAGTVTETEAKAAVVKIEEFNARKRALGIPNPHDQSFSRAGGSANGSANGVSTIRPSAAPLSDDQLLASVMKKLTRAQHIVLSDDSDGLRGIVARPLLKMVIDEVQSLIARLG
jgi:sRNA-binding protein